MVTSHEPPTGHKNISAGKSLQTVLLDVTGLYYRKMCYFWQIWWRYGLESPGKTIILAANINVNEKGYFFCI